MRSAERSAGSQTSKSEVPVADVIG